MESKCTCGKSNWDSLDCPKHGLGVKKKPDDLCCMGCEDCLPEETK